jgi:hypothetical protein
MKNCLSVLFVVFLSGCVILPEPYSDNQTLLIGGIEYNLEFSNINNKIYKGTTYNHVLIELNHIYSGEKISLYSNDGVFFKSDIKSGIYEFNSVTYGHTKCYVSGYIFIKEGEVNNIGLIKFYVTERMFSMENSTNSDYVNIKQKVQNKYPKSKWNSYYWENIRIFSSEEIREFLNTQNISPEIPLNI